jgi:hypothetical protein
MRDPDAHCLTDLPRPAHASFPLFYQVKLIKSMAMKDNNELARLPVKDSGAYKKRRDFSLRFESARRLQICPLLTTRLRKHA